MSEIKIIFWFIKSMCLRRNTQSLKISFTSPLHAQMCRYRTALFRFAPIWHYVIFFFVCALDVPCADFTKIESTHAHSLPALLHRLRLTHKTSGIFKINFDCNFTDSKCAIRPNIVGYRTTLSPKLHIPVSNRATTRTVINWV